MEEERGRPRRLNVDEGYFWVTPFIVFLAFVDYGR